MASLIVLALLLTACATQSCNMNTMTEAEFARAFTNGCGK